MITGASQADTAVLLCAANDGVNAQTKEHAFLAKVLGVSELIVHVNKMDISGVDWSEDKVQVNLRGSQQSAQDGRLRQAIGQDPHDSCLEPQRRQRVREVEQLSMVQGSDSLRSHRCRRDAVEAHWQTLRLPIQDVYKISGIGTVPVGKIETGILNTGKTVVFNPSQKSAEVKSIEMHHTMVDKAEPGDNVGFNVRGLGATDIRRGDVAGYSDNEPTYVRHDETFVGQDPAHGHPQGRLHRLHTCVPLPHHTSCGSLPKAP